MALTANMMTAPNRNTALIRRLSPVLRAPRSSNVKVQVLMTDSGANKAFKI